jgi:hypothetical protein
MKRSFILLLIVSVSMEVFASIDTIVLQTKITDVTVFFTGAQVKRSTEIKFKKGKFMLKIDELPQEINAQSIQVEKINNCKILSVKHQLNYQNENRKGIEETDIQNKIDAQELKIKELKNKSDVFDLEEKLLLDNSLLARKGNGTTIDEIKSAADYYRIRLNEIRQGKLNITVDLEAANKAIQVLYTQLNELTSKKRKTFSQVFIAVECEKETMANLNFSYYLGLAGWKPSYDFRVDDVGKPLTLVFNASVYQSTGEDWNNVNIKLSTNNPTLSGIKPELSTWYLGRREPAYITDVMEESKGAGAIKGRILDAATEEGVAFVTITISQYGQVVASTTTDFEGQYAVKPIAPGTYTVNVKCIGYNESRTDQVKITPEKINFLNVKLNANAIATGVVEVTAYKVPLIDRDETTTGGTLTSEDIRRMPTRHVNSMVGTAAGVYGDNVRGSRSDYNDYYVDGVKVRGSTDLPNSSIENISVNYISNSLKTTVVNLEYVIDIPYTIPSDGEDYTIKIKEVTTPVHYVYYAVPKLDDDAFLTAELTDWTSLNLLSGKSNIYYQGTFTGKSYIDVNNSSDTLRLSLGRDKNILIKRESNRLMADKKILGNAIRETIGWTITVKNNKDTKVKIIIEDQYPVSQRKSMEVDLLESSGANVDEGTGKLIWDLQMEANEKKVLVNKYTVKYPRYTNVAVD